ncbi:MAG TPA: SusD/RagB family nutrient-binding outer membrane lipoprotein [Chryseolinea sp.]|nr:SusD/RagB family nutrient-binding outer membrane lipoprotein [Chryseolinea sp.]
MKKIFNYRFVVVLLVFSVACDNDFDELNTNKTAATAIDPAFQMNTATLNSSLQALIFEIGIVQQIISPNSGVLTGANYNQDNRATTDDNWQGYYRNVIKNTRDVMALTEELPDRANLRNMARILQAHAFMVLTDSYGDIPYSEGGLGYTEQINFPVYESQEQIYPMIIQELTEATGALDAAGKIETAEILYNGDIAKWKKFGYSLLLRAGMRLSKANQTLAASTVSAAFQGGVIVTNADNAVMKHDQNYQNPIGGTLNSTEAANFYLAAPFVNYLKSTSDPRLSAIAVRYVGAKSGPEQTIANQSYDPALQVGMPMGVDNPGAVKAAADLGLASFYDFSQADRRRLTKLSAQYFFVTAAQTNLLLAEARERGWITTGTVGQYYNAGVTAHMEQLGTVDPLAAVPAASISNYLAANPFDPAKALEQINTQYWVASFLNGPEAFANFRRSGFPALAPNPYPGREVTFISRLTYPNSEISVNTENVNAAIANMGPDKLDTKVWWDK